MSEPPIPQWNDRERDANFARPEALAARTTQFERKIRRRNRIEYAAAAIVAVFSGYAGWLAAEQGRWLSFASYVLLFAGILFIAWNLYRRASNLPHKPEEDCRAHLRAQLEHQRIALASVPLWYVGPLLPWLAVSSVSGWIALPETAPIGVIVGYILAVGVALAVFIFVLWINRRGAARLAQTIGELDAESEDSAA